MVWTVWYLKFPELIHFYFFHSLLLYLSLLFALISMDRQVASLRTIGLALVAGFIWLAIEPHLNPVLGTHQLVTTDLWPLRRVVIWSEIIGMISGAGIGLILGLVGPETDGPPMKLGLVTLFSLCGLYFGPSVLLSVTAFSLMLHLAGRTIKPHAKGREPMSLMVSLVLAIHIQVLFWRQLSAIPYWPSHAQTLSYHSQSLQIVVVFAIAIRDRNKQRLA